MAKIQKNKQKLQSSIDVEKYLNDLKNYGISDNDYNLMKEVLAKRFEEEPNQSDIVWGLFNKALNKAMQKSDLQEIGRLYSSMAYLLDDEVKNPVKMLQLSHKMEILNYKTSGVVKGVEILATGCDECKKLNGKKYSIDEALKLSPLPNKNCRFKLNDKSKYSFCRCCYLPVLEEVQ